MAGFRTVVLSNPCALSVQHNQLSVALDGQAVSIAFEDIACIVLGHHTITMTHPVLSTCAQYHIAVICIDNRFMPVGMMVSQASPSPAVRVSQQQRKISKRLCDRMWKTIVHHKVSLQAMVLSLLGHTQTYENLSQLSRLIKDGDPDNREAHASRVYFPALFGSSFSRKKKTGINACLNYGYALIRARLAQYLAMSGCVLSWGIHHHSVENACNLVDDLLEVFRPIVDLFVVRHLVPRDDFDDSRERLEKEEKSILYGLFTSSLFDPKHDETIDCAYAMQITAQRFARALITGHSRELVFCTFCTEAYAKAA